MFRVLNRFKGSQITPEEEEALNAKGTTKILNQAVDFEVALRAMDYVLDDRTEEGLKLLNESDRKNGSPHTISVLARGVIEFLQATLSFEADEMKKAIETLSTAEQLSLKSRTEAQKANLKSSSLYPPGTVYAVTYTESMLLHALLMLFSESLVEAAKALFKLRKAYSMLSEIVELVKNAERKKKAQLSKSSSSTYPESDSSASFVSSITTFTTVDVPYKLSEKQRTDNSLIKLAESIKKMRIERLGGVHIGNTSAYNRLRDDLGLNTSKAVDGKQSKIDEDTYLAEEYDLNQATIDEFISSGTNLCYGILQVVLSLIPPAVGAVLSIVGFRGSREEGLRLIWKSTRQRNVHGCIGLLTLMFYYDGPFQFTDDDFDIPTSDGINKKDTDMTLTKIYTYPSDFDSMTGQTLLHPGKLLENALLQARALFPHSALWLLNEARMLSAKGRLKDAMALMNSIDPNEIRMRQVKVLMVFDRANTLVNLHEYEKAAEELIELIEFSDWSHAFYTYFAGCCYLEKWRMCEMGIIESENSLVYKERALYLILSAPGLLAKKTFRSKNLPLDRFMERKVTQFKSVQKKLGTDNFLDAIGTSPVHEIMYFYNGYNRMNHDSLVLSKRSLTEYHNPATDLKDPDQELTRNLLLSLVLRRLNKIDEGTKLLDENVLPKFFSLQDGRVKYVKKAEDPWAYPTALYERALFSWKKKGVDALPEIKEWLTRAQNYAGDYELSTRISMKIKAALDRVEQAM